VAAIAVVTFHFMEMVIWNYSKLWIGHGFLAVDFFFCLSGFVMGYAYDDRLETMGLWSFLKARLIRLHPMVVAGAVLGLIAFYANPFGVTPGYGLGKVALMFASSLLLIPYGVMKERGQNLFSLNAPSWSLFWEYVANVVFGIALYRVKRGMLAVLTVAAAVLLCWVGYRAGNLSGGWSARDLLVYGRTARLPDAMAAAHAAGLWRIEHSADAGAGNALRARRMDTGSSRDRGVFPIAGSARRRSNDIAKDGAPVPVFRRLIVSAVHDALLGNLDLGRLRRKAQTGDRRTSVIRNLRSRNHGGICISSDGRI
jgi:peptidoglycan/LPS O-acetylase OafA/YrhL